jgi:hypothetical protein
MTLEYACGKIHEHLSMCGMPKKNWKGKEIKETQISFFK